MHHELAVLHVRTTSGDHHESPCANSTSERNDKDCSKAFLSSVIRKLKASASRVLLGAAFFSSCPNDAGNDVLCSFYACEQHRATNNWHTSQPCANERDTCLTNNLDASVHGSGKQSWQTRGGGIGGGWLSFHSALIKCAGTV